MEILPMGSEHVSGVAAVSRECFSMPWSEKAIREELTSPLAVTFVAVEKESGLPGGVVGFINACFVMDEGYVNNIAVTERFRRKHTGTLLLEKMISCGKSRELAFLTLEVRVGNQPAIALYEAMGFLPVGRRKNFYQKPVEDAFLYTLTLKNSGQTANVSASPIASPV